MRQSRNTNEMLQQRDCRNDGERPDTERLCQVREMKMNEVLTQTAEIRKIARPRVGFAGAGWIGRNRLEAIERSGLVEIAAVAEPCPVTDLKTMLPNACHLSSFEQMLSQNLDAVVIATPSAMHAEQALAALRCGAAVYCQKPLGRTAEETREVVEMAGEYNRLLGVDFPYRYVRAVKEIEKRINDGAAGQIYAARLVFHNAYGPDKDWFYNPMLSGGGCVIDLGVHLIDMALWLLGAPGVERCSSRLYCGGVAFDGDNRAVEDYATAQLVTDTGVVIDLACSWKLPAGRDAVIEADFVGTRGALALRNINGSFYDFCAYEFTGPRSRTIFEGPDDWGGRAAVAWAEKLSQSASYDPEIESVVSVAETIDMIYGR